MAHALAERLAIPYYDKKILEDAVLKSGMREEVMKKAEEQLPNALLHSIYYEGNSTEYYGKSANEILYMAQRQIILEYAEKSDCIIVGRCADAILKEQKNVVKVFLYSDEKSKEKRAVKYYHIDLKNASKYIKEVNQERAKHYEYYTNQDWYDFSHYDLCMNVDILGVEETAEQIKNFIDHMKEFQK